MFAQPWMLWALLALAVPILVHLFNFRRPRVLKFTQVRWVQAVAQAVQKRLKLWRYLLLAARLLAVASVVIAFAGPSCSDGQSLAAGGRDVVIVLDNSPSMSVQDGDGQRFQQAKEAARNLLMAAGPNDRFQLQLLSDLRPGGGFVPARSLLAAVDASRLSEQAVGMGRLIIAAPSFFRSATHPMRSLYLLSDFTKGLSDSLSYTPSADSSFQFVGLCIGQPQLPGNLYLSDVALAEPVVDPKQPVKLRFVAHNTRSSAVKAIAVRVELGGKLAGTTTLDIPAGSSVRREVMLSAARTGWQEGTLTIDDPAIAFDNTRFFSLYTPAAYRVLVVADAPARESLARLYTQVLPSVQADVISRAQLSATELADYALLVLAGPERLTSGQLASLDAFVKQGGGVMVFPAPGQPEAVAQLYTQLGAGAWGNAERFSAPVTCQPPDLKEPLLTGLFNTSVVSSGKIEFDSPHIQQLYRFSPAATQPYTILLKTINGLPVVVTQRLGKGRLATWTVPLAADYSDLDRVSLFVPLMYRLTQYLGGSQDQPLAYTLGTAASIELPTPLRDRIELRLHDSLTAIPSQRVGAGLAAFQLQRLPLRSGNWQVYQGDSLVARLGLNLPDVESDLTLVSSVDWQQFIADNGIRQVTISDESPAVASRAFADEAKGPTLWRWWLLVALLALLAEAVLSRFTR